MQDYGPRGFLRPLLSQLSGAPSISGLPVRGRVFCRVILRDSRFRGTYAWLIKNRHSLKLVKPIFDSHHRRKSHRTQHPNATYLISLRDILSKDKNKITDRYCSITIFLKFADAPASTLA